MPMNRKKPECEEPFYRYANRLEGGGIRIMRSFIYFVLLLIFFFYYSIYYYYLSSYYSTSSFLEMNMKKIKFVHAFTDPGCMV